MSNAVEYARKEDAILDLKDEIKADKQIFGTVLACALTSSLLTVGSVAYGIFIDSNRVLPMVMFPLFAVLSIILWIIYAAVRDEKEVSKKKQLRNLEREFKYWALDNPPH